MADPIATASSLTAEGSHTPAPAPAPAPALDLSVIRADLDRATSERAKIIERRKELMHEIGPINAALHNLHKEIGRLRRAHDDLLPTLTIQGTGDKGNVQVVLVDIGPDLVWIRRSGLDEVPTSFRRDPHGTDRWILRGSTHLSKSSWISGEEVATAVSHFCHRRDPTPEPPNPRTTEPPRER